MRIVLAGATGFIGKVLRRKVLVSGHEAVILTRHAGPGGSGRETFLPWDARTVGAWASCLDGADAVINLAGANLAEKRWTDARKQEILSSRVDATRAIVAAIAKARERPAVLINASAVGFYGDLPEGTADETRGAGDGFLAETCVRWEEEARKAELSGVRVALARFGPVLGENGGMLSKMLRPFRLGLGAPLGSGRQWISWIHAGDAAAALLFMLEHGALSGPVNITAPEPTTLRDFCAVLANVLKRPLGFPIPGFFVRMVMGEMADIVLTGQKAVPQKLLEAGYAFRFGALRPALEVILGKNEPVSTA